jgi:hypothetical protein
MNIARKRLKAVPYSIQFKIEDSIQQHQQQQQHQKSARSW